MNSEFEVLPIYGSMGHSRILTTYIAGIIVGENVGV